MCHWNDSIILQPVTLGIRFTHGGDLLFNSRPFSSSVDKHGTIPSTSTNLRQGLAPCKGSPAGGAASLSKGRIQSKLDLYGLRTKRRHHLLRLVRNKIISFPEKEKSLLALSTVAPPSSPLRQSFLNLNRSCSSSHGLLLALSPRVLPAIELEQRPHFPIAGQEGWTWRNIMELTMKSVRTSS